MKKAAFSFKQAGGLGADQLGGKAANLLWLRKHRFNVPDGFCIVSEAYQNHIEPFEINTDDPDLDLVSVRERILEKPIDPAVSAQIQTCYKALSSPVVAVRSSATAEDLPEYSFAGQYTTCLNVKTFADCLEAIKECWASVWSERAYRYRQKKGIDHDQIKMAVIIQEQVPADIAGVMFTADPLRGKTDRIVIEACRGLGEALVSGKVTPDQMIFSKRNLKPIWNLPADSNASSCLDVRMGRQLAKAGRTIEKLYGGSQDIEWAVHRHQVYFVQTRPMTTHPVEQSWEDRQIWTNLNTGEVFPDIVTPLDWSILSVLLKVFFQDLFWILGIEIQNHPLVGVVAGRVYFNVNTGMAFFVNLPSRLIVSRKKASMLFGGGDEKQYDLRKISFGPDDLPDLKVSVWKILRRMPRSLYLLYTRRTSKAFKVLEHLKRNNRHYGSVSYDTMTMPQLAVLLNEILDRSFSKLDALYLHGLASNFIVYILCAKWLGDKNGILANSLLKAAGGMDDVQAGAALVELAQWARRDNSVCDIICFGEHWEDIRPQLIQSDPGRQFFEHWESFMNQHGHHCRSEMLLYNPRWCERPDYVLDMVRACLSKPEQDTPGRRYKQQLHAQNERAEKILNRLRNPIKRWILRKQVKRALDGLAFRENAKSEVVRMLSRVRKMLLRLGQLMSENGILADPEDIFFLAWAELVSIVNGRTDFEVRGTVQQRRGEFERYQAIEPPQVIVGKFDPDSFVPQAVDTSVSVFSGMSACPGKATGKARVILRSDEDQQVLPGEILIAPFTDPGWTPYFVNAAGIVMDQGGLLSHGSVVAREFGIPAVVNVGPATKIIRTGQTVEVNADQGIVRILS